MKDEVRAKHSGNPALYWISTLLRNASPLLVLLTCCVIGCSAPPTIEQPEATLQASVSPTPRPRTPRPSATADVFILLPTGTPLPTWTPIAGLQLYNPGYGPRSFPQDINPLTGMQVIDPDLLNRRPMVIKITNFPRDVRPQWGLTVADHIYEYFLEDGMTRFVGVFLGQDGSRVGPVRSARPFDTQLVRMYKAIFAFGYADDRVIDPLVESDLKNFLVIERPDNCPPMCRIGSKANNYNTLFTNTTQLSQYITDKGFSNGRQNLDGLRFEAKTSLTTGGGPVERIATRFSSTSYHLWEYDPETKRYLRSQDVENRATGEEIYAPLVDSLTGERVAADNLVFLLAPTGFFYQSNSTEIYDISLEGTGTAYALREGKAFKIKWVRRSNSALISLVFPSGQYYPLKPGNVWFEVLSDLSTLASTGINGWQFTFNLPDKQSSAK